MLFDMCKILVKCGIVSESGAVETCPELRVSPSRARGRKLLYSVQLPIGTLLRLFCRQILEFISAMPPMFERRG